MQQLMEPKVQFISVNTEQRHAILERLENVLDPELDESVVKLGFIDEIALNDGEATVVLHLPTSWCAANFAYMMAEDVRNALLGVAGIKQVVLKLPNHFDSQTIEEGVAQGHSFMQTFSAEAAEELGPLRQIFLRKAYTNRQLKFMRPLRDLGLTQETLCTLTLADLHLTESGARVYVEGAWLELADSAPAQRYLDQRTKLGLEMSPSSPMLVNVKGEAISPAQFEEYWRYARTIQIAMEANGSLCNALLHARDEAHRQVQLQQRTYTSTKETFNLQSSNLQPTDSQQLQEKVNVSA